jgi:hypothetical protein
MAARRPRKSGKAGTGKTPGAKGGRTLSDADVSAIANELRAHIGGAVGAITRPSGKNLQEQLMHADRVLAKTFGPVGRTGKHGEPSEIPPARPKRLVRLMAGHRDPHPKPRVIKDPRVTSQVRARVKPASQSRVPRGK